MSDTLVLDSHTAAAAEALKPIERRLLDEFQHDFPLSRRPFADIARHLGCDEEAVLAAAARLTAAGLISRIGAVVAPHRAGRSTLAAMSVPEDRLNDVAALVSAYPEVNHNYEREHTINLWFVVTAENAGRVAEVLSEIEARTGMDVLDLPLIEAYRLELGFPLQWS